MNSSSRGKSGVRVLAVHTTEGMMRAADLRAWTTWAGSSHASADETGALLTPAEGFVPYDRAAWTLLSGNAWSENIELCGFAKWKRTDWLARPLLLDACARWLADRSKARGIPLVKLTPAEYRAGKSGVIGHNDHTVGYSEGTHWDPGPDFPWDVVLGKARVYASPVTILPASQSRPVLEDPTMIVQIEPGKKAFLPTHRVPGGAATWYFNIVSGSDVGQPIYGKRVFRGGHTVGLFAGMWTGPQEWEQFIGMAQNVEGKVDGDLAFIEVVNKGTDTIAVSLTPVA